MCILLNVKKHEKTFALNVDIFKITKIAGKVLDKPFRWAYTEQVRVFRVLFCVFLL